MTINEINANERILMPFLNRSIMDSVRLTFDMCGSSKPQEPDFVAVLSLNFPRDLFNILRALFPAYKLSVTGVFCHQKPIVDIDESNAPEIGDLLLVFRERFFHFPDRLNSLLLQAKVTSSQTLAIKSNEKHQLRLYKEWPEFTYKRAGLLNGVKRDILPKTINNGAKYLLIDTDPVRNGLLGIPGTFPIGCAIANDTLMLDSNLADEIFNFLKFKTGRAFEQRHTHLKDDWSKMIWDLLEIARLSTFTRRNAGFVKTPRTNEYVYFSTNESNSDMPFENLFGNDHFVGENCVEYEGEGVSVILIESEPMDMG